MATNLTSTKVRDSYNQLLHIDGGPDATPKVVYSAVGTATALKVGTASVGVDNILLDGNTITTSDPNGNLIRAGQMMDIRLSLTKPERPEGGEALKPEEEL